jgi:hypothetical protein
VSSRRLAPAEKQNGFRRSANSHTGRRLSSCRIKGRIDDSIRPGAATTRTSPLA